MRRSGRRPAPVRRRDDEVDPKDLLRQEALREADVQELDEQVPSLFRVLLAVVTVTAWQMDRDRINRGMVHNGRVMRAGSAVQCVQCG